MSFGAAIVNPSATDSLTATRRRAACDGDQIGLPHWEDERNLIVQGVDIHHRPGASVHPLDTRWSREGAPGAQPLPFDRIVAHKGFTLDSGVRRSARTEEGFRQTFAGRVKYVFKPVR